LAILGLLDPENESMVIFKNVRSYSAIDTSSCPRRLESSTYIHAYSFPQFRIATLLKEMEYVRV
jgi:hypothetical protein